MLKTVSSITNAIGALNYKGTWNASTNSPALASGVGTKGDYYVVSVAGSTNLDGETLWGVGDWAVYNGAAWQKVEGGNTINATTVSASTSVTTPIVQSSTSAGTTLKNASGTTCIQYGAGGGTNVTIEAAINMNGANAHIEMSPTGTGHVTINPTAVGDMDNMVIGATTPKAITGTTITATTFSGAGTSLTGTASGLTAGNVTTNANLTGPITSVGNATSIASQTGTGTKFVMDTSPTITGATLTTAVLNGSLGATTASTVAATTITTSGTLFVGSATGFNARKLYLLYDDTANNGFAINESTGAASTQFQLFASNGTTCGSIVRVGSTSAVTYGAVSDYRLKTVTATVSDAGKRIDSLKPIEYDWNNGDGHARGFLAHEFAEVYPNSVAGEKDAVDEDGNPSYQSMQASTSEVMADLIAEIQSLRKRVAQLELK